MESLENPNEKMTWNLEYQNLMDSTRAGSLKPETWKLAKHKLELNGVQVVTQDTNVLNQEPIMHFSTKRECYKPSVYRGIKSAVKFDRCFQNCCYQVARGSIWSREHGTTTDCRKYKGTNIIWKLPDHTLYWSTCVTYSMWALFFSENRSNFQSNLYLPLLVVLEGRMTRAGTLQLLDTEQEVSGPLWPH
jgi:hypothetical protein